MCFEKIKNYKLTVGPIRLTDITVVLPFLPGETDEQMRQMGGQMTDIRNILGCGWLGQISGWRTLPPPENKKMASLEFVLMLWPFEFGLCLKEK